MQPLNQLRPDSPHFSPFRTPVQYPPQYPPRIMANVNANKPPPPPAWRDRSPLNLTHPLHAMPRNFNKSWPKFEPNEGILVDDHLQSFYLALEGLQAAEHEDVVCTLFPHTLKGNVASWYFSLQENSITNWNTFEILFRNKYGIQENS